MVFNRLLALIALVHAFNKENALILIGALFGTVNLREGSLTALPACCPAAAAVLATDTLGVAAAAGLAARLLAPGAGAGRGGGLRVHYYGGVCGDPCRNL